MTRAHVRYVCVEATVGAAFTAVASLVFALLLFRGERWIPLRGAAGLIADAIPQTMAGGFMCVVVPTALTRLRLRRGALVAAPGRSRLPRNILLRGIVLASAATGAALALHAVLLAGPPAWRLVFVVAWKVIYGAAMGFVVAGAAARAALLDDGTPRRPGRRSDLA